ncbi:hypothetical protein [Sedimenticola sp.]|uniref:hypothetical protein n=1 Tax=Sedimenticola sp. TaxID=1940285 RepID=UPI003D0F2BED
MPDNLPQNLKLGIDALRHKGLNLFAVMSVRRLPDQAIESLTRLNPLLSDDSRIILIGHGGKTLWERLSAEAQPGPDPIDHYSGEAALRFSQEVLPPGTYQLLYPGDSPISLQRLGTIAGWHNPSPLGIGIHPQWGLWYAYRAVILTNEPLPEILQPTPPSPCAACHEKPCLSVCPAGALAEDKMIDRERCAHYRLGSDSRCGDRCVARWSCPVSTDQRYTLEQVQYHYRLSLETLRHYYS